MNTQELAYRSNTIWNAFWALYRLPPAKMEAFLNAYAIFDREWDSQEYDDRIKHSLVDYYSVLNYLCAIGQVEKMYIPPTMDASKSILENQRLFETKLARDLGVKKGDRVLDVGCGRGRVAAHIASMTGAHVSGFNVDKTQIESAQRFAKSAGLADQTHFQLGDLNRMPFAFADESFDKIYDNQAFSYSKDLNKMFKELHRLLKPKGRFACLEYVLKDAYDPSNPVHSDLLRRTKPVLGAIGSPKISDYINAMQNAGFEIVMNEEASVGGHQAPLIEKAHGFYTGAAKWISRLVRVKILPKHFDVLFERLSRGGDAFVQADRLGLLSTSWYIVAQKR
jgi:sterol 24-C-methyltransferase